jgi:hypothetical protein
MQKFWWGHQSNESRIHWMSWKQMELPKSQDVMGFRDLHNFNKAVLAKQVWHMWSQPDSLVALILKAKYYTKWSIFEVKVGNKPSFAW